MTVGIRKTFMKRYSVTLSQELRLRDITQQRTNTFTEIDLGAKVGKSFRFNVFYRHIFAFRDDSREIRQRIGVDGNWKYKIVKKLHFLYRTRYQWQWEEYEYQYIPQKYWRNRVGLEYKLHKKWTAFSHYEMWYNFSQGEDREFDRYRINSGLEWEPTKHHKIEIFGLFQKEMNRRRIDSDAVIGLAYRYDL
ncbi:MAG: DUF2490 domain-containing protein [Runella sp.]